MNYDEGGLLRKNGMPGVIRVQPTLGHPSFLGPAHIYYGKQEDKSSNRREK